MPQLDFITYFYQYNWLLLTFFVFYIFSLKNVFPSIALVLKARAKKTLRDKKDLFNIESEEKTSLMEYETNWETALKIKERQTQHISILQTKSSLAQTESIK